MRPADGLSEANAHGRRQKDYRLGDGCSIKHGFAFKGVLMTTDGPENLPIVVNIVNFQYTGGFRFNSTKIQRYTGPFPEDYILKPGDILVVMTCQTPKGEILGVPGRIPKDGRAYLHNQRLGLVCVKDPAALEIGYLYYLFLSPRFSAHLFGTATGAKILHTAPSRIEDYRFNCPPIPTQRKIAGVLSAYDDLIENNTRRIRILEEMAQAIYREWFVHFRFPGHKRVKLVPSPLGPIPHGWEVKRVTDAVSVDPTTSVPKEGEKPFVPMSSLSNDSMLVRDIESRTGNSGSKFRSGDTLFARITPCLENGKTAFVQFLPTGEDVAFGSTEFIVLRSKTLSPEFVYLLARTPEFRNTAIKSMSGATGRQRVQPACFDKFRFAHPDASTLQVFGEQVAPMFQEVHLIAQRNENLRKTRDLLLPKLISGEVDVSDLDISVGDEAA